MRREAEGFLARIRAVPEDDAPRLIYADWLDDQGDPRGEFIRFQIALDRTPEYDRRRGELERVNRDLMSRYADRWSASLQGLASGSQFRRGFIEETKVSAPRFLSRGEELFSVEPIRHLHILDLGGNLAPVFQSPLLAKLSGLTIFGQHLKDTLARALAESPHLGGLRRLHIGRNRIGDSGVEYLLAAPMLFGLEDLDLGENELSETGARALATEERFPRLKRLELAGNTVGPVTGGRLADPERFPALEYLGLSGNRIGGPRAVVAEGVGSLFRIPKLNLSANGLTPEGIRRFVSEWDVRSESVRELSLSHNELGDAGLAALVQSPAMSEVRLLNASANRITDVGLVALAASPHLGRLSILDLTDNPIGDDGCRALLASSSLRMLRRLILPGVGPSMQLRLKLQEKYDNDR